MEMRLCIMIPYNVSQLFIRDTFILNVSHTDWSPSILLFSQHHFDSRVPIVCGFFCYFHSIAILRCVISGIVWALGVRGDGCSGDNLPHWITV